MSLLNYLVSGQIDAAKRETDGKILSRPALLVSDGLNLTYGCDVDIGQKTLDDVGAEVVAPLRNVPIASAAQELLYADVGAAVRLRRSDSGRWEVIGFSKREPGSYTRIAVTVPSPGIAPVPYQIGTPQSVGLTVRALTYEELATFGGYGVVPYGAVAVFRGPTILEIRS